MTEAVEVLYFVGKGRSGTTLLDNILGQLDGYVSTGEITKLWNWGFKNGWSCGCGQPVPTCPFWLSVMEAGFGAVPDVDEMLELQREVMRWPNVPRLIYQSMRDEITWPALDEFVGILSGVYRGIAQTSGANVVIDSSKWPAFPTALGIVPDIDVHLLHLVRDPRAVAHSWKRRKEWTDRDEGQEMPRYGAIYSAASYWARNLTAEFVARSRSPLNSIHVRYEDLVLDPQGEVQRIIDAVGAPSVSWPFIDERSIELTTTHTAGGNPNRTRTGVIEIRPDLAWRTNMGTVDRAVVTALTLPFLKRYGYPLRSEMVNPSAQRPER